MYWDIEKTLSYGRFLNLINGNRGGGKTYGSKKWIVKHFLKTKNKFVWVRRYKQEFRGNEKFFGKVQIEFPETKFAVDGATYKINDEPAGYKMVLSTSRMQKGIEFPDVDTIVFDEFLIDKGVYHYLPSDVETFLDLIDTVFRGRNDVRVLCLSNTITIVNPYFSYFDIYPPENPGIVTKGEILCEKVADPDFIAEKSKSRFGHLIAGTAYGAYNISAEFRQDDDNFIGQKQGKCVYEFTLFFRGQYIGVWSNKLTGKIYCTEQFDKNFPRCFSLTLADHTPNTLLLSSVQRTYYLKMFAKNFRMGNVLSENQRIKKSIFEIVKMLQNA